MEWEDEERKNLWAPALKPGHGWCCSTLPFAGWGHLGLWPSIRGKSILALPPARRNPHPRQESQQKGTKNSSNHQMESSLGWEVWITAAPPQPRWEVHIDAADTNTWSMQSKTPSFSFFSPSLPPLSRKSQLIYEYCCQNGFRRLGAAAVLKAWSSTHGAHIFSVFSFFIVSCFLSCK